MLNFPESALKLVQIQSVFTDMRMQQWRTDTLFTWQWWLLVALLIIPWILWFCIIDKKRLTEIVLLGMFMLATASWMDDLGTDLILWHYPFKLLPVYPQLLPINYAVLPVTYMLIYQYFRSWNSYLKALTIMALLFSFIAEPALDYLGMYKMLCWQYYYSFPIYVLLGIFFRWLVEKILAINKRYSCNN
ncbi:CBO0543 family protein [Pelosinus sp. sgz500959]|uniref:CBO0543 family protein n=1 Tax=Pelosinus sp. sgz500959 TaxID=3242472 RepID=UPI00366AA0E1